MNETAEDITATTAQHEAGHAVMRSIVGLPATEVEANEKGGFCAGSGRKVGPWDVLPVALAGFAWKAATGWAVHSTCRTAMRPISRRPRRCSNGVCGSGWLLGSSRVPDADGSIPCSVVLSVDDAMQRAFSQAGERLLPHSDLVDSMAERLTYERRLSARQVAADVSRALSTRGRGADSTDTGNATEDEQEVTMTETKTRKTKHRNKNLSKRCDCGHRNWTRCDHGWWFNLYRDGKAYRVSLDQHANRHIATKGEAEDVAGEIRAAIKAGTFGRSRRARR